MITWLSEWLKDIIAVIMLAVLVELILPNKSMQRYARLVIGLLILLTILSPILRLLQGDFNTRLNNGIQLWEDSASKYEVKMPTLDDITKKAAQLSEKRNKEAAALTKHSLESAMKQELVDRTNAPIDKVEVVLRWVNNGQELTPYVDGVTVSFASSEQVSNSASSAQNQDVQEVEPVAVGIEIDQIEVQPAAEEGGFDPADGSKETAAGTASEAWARVEPAVDAQIRSVLADGWGVKQEVVIVRQPAPSGTEQ